MGIYMMALPIISMLLGLYLICLGLWELRVGLDRKRFIKFSFTGLFFDLLYYRYLWVSIDY